MDAKERTGWDDCFIYLTGDHATCQEIDVKLRKLHAGVHLTFGPAERVQLIAVPLEVGLAAIEIDVATSRNSDTAGGHVRLIDFVSDWEGIVGFAIRAFIDLIVQVDDDGLTEIPCAGHTR